MHERNGAPWRRRLLIVVALLSLVAAACGSDDDGASDDDATAEADPNGVLRIATSLLATASSTQFDPATIVTPSSLPQMMVYDTLLRAQLDGTYEPGLAKSATVVDPTTVKVELNTGIKFTDGTPLDAEAVKFSIDRMVAANNPGAIAAEMKQVDTVTVDSPTQVTIKLKTPIAGIFYVYLSRGETMIVSPTAVKNGVDLKTAPVGAGAYKLESLALENKMVMVKNPDYFQADKIKTPTIEFIHSASPDSTVNALKTNVADVADQATPDIIRNLEGQPGIKIRQEVSDSTLFWGQTCKSRSPLDNVKVRQALNFAIDRDALNTVLYDGKSEPQWGFWSKESKFHDPKLNDFYKLNIDKAKSLLTEAGFPNGFTTQLVVSNVGGITTTAAELIQAQWAKINVKVELVASSNIVNDFFIENKYPTQFFPLQRQGLDKVTRNLVPGSIGNICNWNHAGLNDLVAKIRAVAQDSDEAVKLWYQLDKLALEEAMNFFGVFGTSGNAWNDSKLANVKFIPNFQGVPFIDFYNVYVKK